MSDGRWWRPAGESPQGEVPLREAWKAGAEPRRSAGLTSSRARSSKGSSTTESEAVEPLRLNRRGDLGRGEASCMQHARGGDSILVTWSCARKLVGRHIPSRTAGGWRRAGAMKVAPARNWGRPDARARPGQQRLGHALGAAGVATEGARTTMECRCWRRCRCRCRCQCRCQCRCRCQRDRGGL